MKRIVPYIFILFCTFISSELFAQADISMATHWYNRGNYNPAAIARTEYIYVFSNIRQQWTGIAMAPKVVNFQVSEYIHKARSAFGLSMISDKMGVTESINPMLTYAYRMENRKGWTLSLGVSGGIFSRSIDGSFFEAVNVSDPALFNDLEKITLPDANVGVEVQTRNFIFGLSSTHLFSIAKDSSLFLNANHRYGYVIFKNNTELMNYNFGIQLVNRYNMSVLEGSANLRFKNTTGLTIGPRETLDIGVIYRSTNQITLMMGLNITSNFRVGYAYDHILTTGYSQNGTHEIMLEYRIPSKAASTCIQCRVTEDWYH